MSATSFATWPDVIENDERDLCLKKIALTAGVSSGPTIEIFKVISVSPSHLFRVSNYVVNSLFSVLCPRDKAVKVSITSYSGLLSISEERVRVLWVSLLFGIQCGFPGGDWVTTLPSETVMLQRFVKLGRMTVTNF